MKLMTDEKNQQQQRQGSGRTEMIRRRLPKGLVLFFKILIIKLIVLVVALFIVLNVYLIRAKAKFMMGLIKEHTALYDNFYKKSVKEIEELLANKELLRLFLQPPPANSADVKLYEGQILNLLNSLLQYRLDGTLLVVVHNRASQDRIYQYKTFVVNPLDTLPLPMVDYLFDDPLYAKALSLTQPVIGRLSHATGSDSDCFVYHKQLLYGTDDGAEVTFFLLLPGDYIKKIYGGIGTIKDTTLVITDLFDTPVFVNHPDDSDDYMFDYEKQIYMDKTRPGVRGGRSGKGIFASSEDYKELSYYRKLVTDATIIHLSAVQKMRETLHKNKGEPVWEMLSYKRGTYLATYYQSKVSSVSVFDFKPFSSLLYPGVLFCAFIMLVCVTALIYLYINLSLAYKNTIILSERFIERYNLSARETEIIYAVLDNLSNREIAHRFFISIGTVKTHINNIFKKIGCSSRSSLIKQVKKFN